MSPRSTLVVAALALSAWSSLACEKRIPTRTTAAATDAYAQVGGSGPVPAPAPSPVPSPSPTPTVPPMPPGAGGARGTTGEVLRPADVGAVAFR